MNTTAGTTQKSQSKAPAKDLAAPRRHKIHPVVIYPYRQPGDFSDLEELFRMVAALDASRDEYARPITVVDRKTCYAMEGSKPFIEFRKGTVARYSDILDAWCVDTCQMWYSGLGMAFERGEPGDVYWLIPGDFNYGTAVGKDVLGRLHDLPQIVLELRNDLCIGEIETDHCNSKQLIDTYGTFALLYTWFPDEAREIRRYTERPRSEFFAVRHAFLQAALCERWYPYEQTMVMLLRAVASNGQISRFFVGNISDLPQGKESLASVMQQIDRTERVLKTLWRERNQGRDGWAERYRALEQQSEEVRRAAVLILQNLCQ